MAIAMPKTAENRAAGARARASIVDAMSDGVIVSVDVTDELLGQLLRGRVDHILVSIIGQEWLDAQPLRLVRQPKRDRRLDRLRIKAEQLEEKLDNLADKLELDGRLDIKLERQLSQLAQRASHIKDELDRAMDE